MQPARRWTLFATAWGFAEATLFFVVPDVLLSWLALERPRRAFVACLGAVVGALVGGLVMWIWGTRDPDSARRILDALPGIRAELVASVGEDLRRDGLRALVLGPLAGVPYKLFAVEWGALGGSPWPFLAISVPARLARFALLTALGAAARAERIGLSLRAARWLHALSWLLFYAFYFAAMEG